MYDENGDFRWDQQPTVKTETLISILLV